MRDVFLIIYLISLSTGFISISVSLILYFKHHKKVLKYFAFFTISMLIEILYFIGKYYFKNISFGNESLIEFFLRTIYVFGFSVFLFTFPFFMIHLLLIKLSLQKKIIFYSISSAILILYILQILIKFQFTYVYIIINIFFISTMIYCFTIAAFNIKNITDKRLKKILLIFLIIAIVFSPLIIFDVIIERVSISLPIYFFTINTLGIIFSFLYLNQPPFVENNQLTEYFIKKYNITEREKEIISLMKMGFSNNEISDKIFISIHTVENHIYNIYQKLNIKNRVQLFNLIQTNSK